MVESNNEHKGEHVSHTPNFRARLIVAFVGIVAGLTSAHATASSTQYEWKPISEYFYQGALNNNGDISGYTDADGWSRGFLSVAPVLNKRQYLTDAPFPTDLTDDRRVVGITERYDGYQFQYAAFITEANGQNAQLLEFDGDYLTSAHTITNSGLVGGNLALGQGIVIDTTSGQGWLLPNGAYSFALNEQGQSVGVESVYGEGPPKAYLYDLQGGRTLIGSLGGSTIMPTDISDAGDVVGGANDAVNRYHAFYYDHSAGTLRDLTPDAYSSRAMAVNNDGIAIGLTWTIGGSGQAFVTGADGQGFFYLNDVLLRPNGAPDFVDVADINDKGEILAIGDDRYMYLLSPVPEPSTVALMLLGAVSLMGVSRQRRRQASS